MKRITDLKVIQVISTKRNKHDIRECELWRMKKDISKKNALRLCFHFIPCLLLHIIHIYVEPFSGKILRYFSKKKQESDWYDILISCEIQLHECCLNENLYAVCSLNSLKFIYRRICECIQRTSLHNNSWNGISTL